MQNGSVFVVVFHSVSCSKASRAVNKMWNKIAYLETSPSTLSLANSSITGTLFKVLFLVLCLKEKRSLTCKYQPCIAGYLLSVSPSTSHSWILWLPSPFGITYLLFALLSKISLAQGYCEWQAFTEGLLGLERASTAQNRKQLKLNTRHHSPNNSSTTPTLGISYWPFFLSLNLLLCNEVHFSLLRI